MKGTYPFGEYFDISPRLFILSFIGFALLGGGILALCVKLGLEILIGESVLSVALSFLLGFVGNLAIVGSSFLALLKQVQIHTAQEAGLDKVVDLAQSTESSLDSKNSESSTQDFTQEATAQNHSTQKGGFISRFVVGTRLSVSFLRIVSFFAFGVVMIWLLAYDMMVIFALFTGLVCALCALCAIGFGMVYKAKGGNRL